MTTYRGGPVPQTPAQPLTCTCCSAPASHSNLAAHGTMCYPCYAAYCRNAFKPRPSLPDSPTVADMRTRVRPGHRLTSSGGATQ
jgi:hypothetical protein